MVKVTVNHSDTAFFESPLRRTDYEMKQP